MGKTRVIGLATVLLVGLMATGCSIPGVCTAIGWMNTVSVELTGNAGSVADLEVCADGACASAADLQPAADEPLRLATELPQETAPSTPAATSPPLLFSITRVDERTWEISLDMQSPETLTLRAVSAAGEVLTERDVALEWRRVGGTEQCGGPAEAGPVSLDIRS